MASHQNRTHRIVVTTPRHRACRHAACGSSRAKKEDTVPKDSRSIGEKLGDIERQILDANQERGVGRARDRAREQREHTEFITDRDSGDEESPRKPDRMSER